MTVSVEWLKKINQEFRDAEIEPRKRPWEALSRYSLEFKSNIELSSPVATEIFEWFKSQSKPGSHNIGSIYESVYYFDAEFWTVSIPIFFGTVKLNPIDCLREMPESLKAELTSRPELTRDYVTFWTDCLDYGIGISELSNERNLDPFGLKLLMAADQELRSAISQLKEKKPDSRAILTCRMATEIFLKAYIALKEGLTESEAKALNHNLQVSFKRFMEISMYADWKILKSKLDVFPTIHERYNKQSHPLIKVWDGFVCAQSIGAVIIREKTGRNTLKQVLSSNSLAR